MDTRVNGVSLDGGGMSNPMTTLGDLITGGASGAPARLAAGAEGEVLTVSSGVPAWVAPAGGIDTSLQSAPDTGWTAGGAGSASIAAGVATLTMTAAQADANLFRGAPMSPLCPALEVTARITRTVSTSDFHWFGIAFQSTDALSRFRLFAGSDAFARAFVNATEVGSAALPATIGGGQLWLRIVVTPYMVAWYVGVGASRPATWTRVAVQQAVLATLADAIITRLVVESGRVTGTGTATAEVADIQWRSLLGAPT